MGWVVVVKVLVLEVEKEVGGRVPVAFLLLSDDWRFLDAANDPGLGPGLDLFGLVVLSFNSCCVEKEEVDV